MKTNINCIKKILNIRKFKFVLIIVTIFSCEDIIEVDSPINQIPSEIIFQDETTAEAAVNSLYAKLRDDTFLNGHAMGLNSLLGFYSDELIYYGSPASELITFYNHQIIPSNSIVKSLWQNGYSLIYMTNNIIEGLENSPHIEEGTKKQLKGEALFIRSLCHFFLTNLFGDIPYVTSTDRYINQVISKTEESEVYNLIINDLTESKSLVGFDYPTSEKIRANKYVVSALLSRVYLYSGNWQKAISESSDVINQTSLYSLEIDLNNEFLKNSNSAILQLKPKLNGENTAEGNLFWIGSGPPYVSTMNPELYSSFEEIDKRRSLWIRVVSDGTTTWYSPYKYKEYELTESTLEYSTVFRISEMYLNRAEAFMNLGNLSAAMSDLNTIRTRAGLPSINIFTPHEVFEELKTQKKLEFFTEQGFRWFDIKRWGIANAILSPIKVNWKPTDILLPLPETEIMLNPNLNPQNNGY